MISETLYSLESSGETQVAESNNAECSYIIVYHNLF